MIRPFALLCSALVTLGTTLHAAADPGKPVAVRWWGQSFITIETWWGPSIAIDPFEPRIGYEDPKVQADLVLITHEHFDHNNATMVRGLNSVERALKINGDPRRVNVVLDRYPNQEKAQTSGAELRLARSEHAIWIENIPAYHDDEKGTKRGNTGMFLIRVDGLRILHCGDLGQTKLSDDQLTRIGDIDLLLIPVGGVFTIDGTQAVPIVEQISPRIAMPIHYKTEALTIELEPVDGFLEALPEKYERVEATGNTLAITHNAGPTRESPQVVVLGYQPWRMPKELAALFDKKEEASKASQAAFHDLTAFQLNHKPSNGTHTPRWNAEHMAGTELWVMSSILSKLDPSIPVIRQTPKQMPPDYTPAHSEWPGPEQARYMQRVSDFSRRFAYLLNDKSLDDLPEGCPKFFGSLRGFLLEMEDHYGEHTAHVHTKFELEDWPKREH